MSGYHLWNGFYQKTGLDLWNKIGALIPETEILVQKGKTSLHQDRIQIDKTVKSRFRYAAGDHAVRLHPGHDLL